MIALELLPELIHSLPDVAEIRVIEFPAQLKLQDKVSNPTQFERRVFEAAVNAKTLRGTHFREALLATMVEKELFSQRLLDCTLEHNANERVRRIPREQVKDFSNGPITTNIALNSALTMKDGREMHLPLLDFKVEISPTGKEVAEGCIRALGLSGFLLDSGRSYHFWGDTPIEPHKIIDILARFTLLHPVADAAWAAHQILERSASLRLGAKAGRSPVVLCKVSTGP